VITTIFFLENGQKGDSAKSENFKVLAGGWIVSKSNGDVSWTLSRESSSNQSTIFQFRTLPSDKFQLPIELPVDGTSTPRGTLWTQMEIDHLWYTFGTTNSTLGRQQTGKTLCLLVMEWTYRCWFSITSRQDWIDLKGQSVHRDLNKRQNKIVEVDWLSIIVRWDSWTTDIIGYAVYKGSNPRIRARRGFWAPIEKKAGCHSHTDCKPDRTRTITYHKKHTKTNHCPDLHFQIPLNQFKTIFQITFKSQISHDFTPYRHSTSTKRPIWCNRPLSNSGFPKKCPASEIENHSNTRPRSNFLRPLKCFWKGRQIACFPFTPDHQSSITNHLMVEDLQQRRFASIRQVSQRVSSRNKLWNEMYQYLGSWCGA
jgi:hypothetical protein